MHVSETSQSGKINTFIGSDDFFGFTLTIIPVSFFTIISTTQLHTEKMEKLNRITVNPNVCLGQPTIRGMRITVSVILKMLASDKSVAEILEAYPELEAEDVQITMSQAIGDRGLR